ncbi:flavin-containing monooxygenase FMO GS-OX-like 5 [Nymphaea colorata]|nr:flavin-containing monooxygenase FMO GS-OX-like 5 [Nymphaea colorata]
MASFTTLPAMVIEALVPAARKRAGKEVAVIGAGAAGLAAGRELRREGHRVVVFERGNTVGGTWVYTPEVESPDLLGVDPNRTLVHSSVYESLRTNLPREVMGFLDYPFSVRPGCDGRRFPSHQEVAAYLADFAADFDLVRWIRLETEVVNVVQHPDGRWLVRSRRALLNRECTPPSAAVIEEVFDAVVVCNGHYTEPRLAVIPGIEKWRGKQMHSHNYRVPGPFADKVVVLIGGYASAKDISRDIAPVAKEVHVSSRTESGELPRMQPGYANMWLHSLIKSTHEDGGVVFSDGSSVIADIIIHCTGYKFRFPFLDSNGAVTVDDNRVGPLYKHVFPPSLAPSLSFIGIPWKVYPFPLFELQSKWVAGVLSGRISLPSEREMLEDVEAFYLQIEAAGYPKRYTHNISSYQSEYDDWLSMQCGCMKVEEWRKEMFAATYKNRIARPENYRDEWDDHDLVLQAQEHFLTIE